MSTKSAREILEKRLGPITFGGFLRSARTMRDMTQVEMAAFLGMSKSTLCDIEKGRQIVSIELAAKIANKCELLEALAVKCAIMDQLRRAGLKYEFELVRSKKSA